MALGITAALCCAASPVSAQVPEVVQRQPTDGVARPIHDYSGSGDASSLELNPALIGAVEGADFVVRGYAPTDDLSRGGGVGAWLSLNFLPGVALALGLQQLQPRLGGGTFDASANANPEATKLTLGGAFGEGEIATVGFAVSALRRGGRWLQSADLDLGALFRITNYASLGISSRLSPGASGVGAFDAHLDMRGELAVRPLGRDLLEFAGGVNARIVDRSGLGLDEAVRRSSAGDLYPRGRLTFRWEGLSLSGEVAQVAVDRLDTNTLQIATSDRALQGSVALGVAFDYASLETGLRAGASGVDGVGLMARASTHKQGRVWYPRRVDVERLEFSEVGDQRSFIRMLERIELAERGGERSVLLLDTRGVSAGWATLHELREALIRVRDAGGHVFAYTEIGGLEDYYLASAAERIYLHPAGELQTYGLSATSLYFRDALAKIGVRVEANHIGEFKAAHEAFTRSSRSAPDRAQREALLDDLYATVVYDIARARGLSLAEVRALIDGAPYGPKEALEAGLVDEIVFRDELPDRMSAQLGADVDFASFSSPDRERTTWSAAPYIAVVLVEGTIVDGRNIDIPFFGIHNTGADTIVETLRELRADRACRGIVLRVDSPGGSALASDLIWREVARTHEAHLEDRRAPAIVVSMGDVAASGGYYVSMGARQIFADPNTITGSIGVVSLHFDLSGLLEKLGIATDTLTRGALADVDSPWKPWSDEERARLLASMTRTYDLFRSRVAEGRGLTEARVDELGRGHVYSGRDALDLGLVDELGGLRAAIDWAETQAGRRRGRGEFELRVLPRRAGLLALILDSVGPELTAGVAARRKARVDARGAKRHLPPALDAALARLPLSVLFLHDGRAATLMPAALELSGGR